MLVGSSLVYWSPLRCRCWRRFRRDKSSFFFLVGSERTASKQASFCRIFPSSVMYKYLLLFVKRALRNCTSPVSALGAACIHTTFCRRRRLGYQRSASASKIVPQLSIFLPSLSLFSFFCSFIMALCTTCFHGQ